MEQLNVQNAVVMGNSSGGAACAWIAVHQSPRVKGVVFLGAVLRDVPMGVGTRVALWLMFAGPWATWSWLASYNSIYKKHPVDHTQYLAALKRCMGGPGRIGVLRMMLAASKGAVGAVLSQVQQPVLAICGAQDPDFADPQAELVWIAKTIPRVQQALLQDCGHYPHLEYTDKVFELIQSFVTKNLR